MKIIFSPSTIPTFNLAAEEYLFSKREEEWIFLYVNRSCVVIGYNQAVINEVNLTYCISEDIAIIRRMSGGGAVYHDLGNLNYCFISDKTDNPLSAGFLRPVVEVLQTMEIPVEIGKRKDLWLPDGHKISGTASHVSKGRELHHGTLLYDIDLEKLQRALDPASRNLVAKASPSVPSSVKNIRLFLGERNRSFFTFSEFIDRFTGKIMQYMGVSGLTLFSVADTEAIETLRCGKYAKREWNFKM